MNMRFTDNDKITKLFDGQTIAIADGPIPPDHHRINEFEQQIKQLLETGYKPTLTDLKALSAMQETAEQTGATNTNNDVTRILNAAKKKASPETLKDFENETASNVPGLNGGVASNILGQQNPLFNQNGQFQGMGSFLEIFTKALRNISAEGGQTMPSGPSFLTNVMAAFGIDTTAFTQRDPANGNLRTAELAATNAPGLTVPGALMTAAPGMGMSGGPS